VIRDDTELQATQERILRFERFLAEARKTASSENYRAMAEGYLIEIDRMQAEIRQYLSELPDAVEAA
jgi:D-serine dehydratase